MYNDSQSINSAPTSAGASTEDTDLGGLQDAARSAVQMVQQTPKAFAVSSLIALGIIALAAYLMGLQQQTSWLGMDTPATTPTKVLFDLVALVATPAAMVFAYRRLRPLNLIAFAAFWLLSALAFSFAADAGHASNLVAAVHAKAGEYSQDSSGFGGSALGSFATQMTDAAINAVQTGTTPSDYGATQTGDVVAGFVYTAIIAAVVLFRRLLVPRRAAE